MLSEYFDTQNPFVQAYHGFGGSGLDFSEVVLRSKYSWNAVDLLGHGSSPAPHDPALYSAQAQVEHCVSVAKGKVLLGYSMGGRLALQVLSKFPKLWSGAILVSTTAGLLEGREKRRTWDRAMADKILSEGLEHFWNHWSTLDIIRSQSTLPPPFKKQRRERRLALDPYALAASMIGFGAGTMPSIWMELSKIELPILLLTGTEDVKYREIATRLQASLPLCVHRSLDGCGHAPHLEAPDRFLVEVERWLDGVFG